MKKRIFACATSALLLAITSSADDKEKDEDRLKNASTVLTEILNIPDDIPQDPSVASLRSSSRVRTSDQRVAGQIPGPSGTAIGKQHQCTTVRCSLFVPDVLSATLTLSD
jgi:hypothetical protein